MSSPPELKRKINELENVLSLDKRDQIRHEANGGNTVLFVYPPEEEEYYIDGAKKHCTHARFIDIRKLLIDYIESFGLDDFKIFYNSYKNPQEVFADGEEDPKLEALIIEEITNAIEKDETPFLIHTGALYGTGIENVRIMQNADVMKFGTPLVIFYPAVEKSDTELDFLGVKPASKYRCKMVK